MRRFLLLSPDAPAGGDGAPGAQLPPTSPPAGGDLPPAASVVINSPARAEDAAELVKLREDLETERQARKAREVRISELEDENHRLKTPAPAPAAAVKPKRDRWTFMDPE